eukprot:Trichotokara_eunicae@DN786_c0_g1_i2.p1
MVQMVNTWATSNSDRCASNWVEDLESQFLFSSTRVPLVKASLHSVTREVVCRMIDRRFEISFPKENRIIGLARLSQLPNKKASKGFESKILNFEAIGRVPSSVVSVSMTFGTPLLLYTPATSKDAGLRALALGLSDPDEVCITGTRLDLRSQALLLRAGLDPTTFTGLNQNSKWTALVPKSFLFLFKIAGQIFSSLCLPLLACYASSHVLCVDT